MCSQFLLSISVVDLKTNPGVIYMGEPKGKVDCTLTLDDEDMVALVTLSLFVVCLLSVIFIYF